MPILSTSQVTLFKRLSRRSEGSRHRVLGPLKAELRQHLPEKRPNYNMANKQKADEPEPLGNDTSFANHEAFQLAFDLELLGNSGCEVVMVAVIGLCCYEYVTGFRGGVL